MSPLKSDYGLALGMYLFFMVGTTMGRLEVKLSPFIGARRGEGDGIFPEVPRPYTSFHRTTQLFYLMGPKSIQVLILRTSGSHRRRSRIFRSRGPYTEIMCVRTFWDRLWGPTGPQEVRNEGLGSEGVRGGVRTPIWVPPFLGPTPTRGTHALWTAIDRRDRRHRR